MTFKYPSILMFFLFFAASCDKNCQDCEPYTIRSYTVVNKRGLDMALVFFNAGGQKTTVLLAKDKDVLLRKSSRVSFQGALNSVPIIYDSLKIISSPSTEHYGLMNCELVSNLLCEQNYTLNSTKDGIGNTVDKFVIELK